MKKILGLDIGTNSIGWAFIESNAYENPEQLEGRILNLGSRIIPMDGDALNKFESGVPESRAAARRQARGVRRLNQRYKLRRTRLLQALKILGWISNDFPTEFKRLSKHDINQFLPYSNELIKEAEEFFEINELKTTRGLDYHISEDWIIYYLKTKAIKKQVSLTELGRILYHYNQRRGFKSSRKDSKIEEEISEVKYPIYDKWVEIVKINDIIENGKGDGKDKEFTFYKLICQTPTLQFEAIKKRKNPLDWKGKEIEIEITRKTTKSGDISFTISEVDPAAWESRKRALENDIRNEGLPISEYYLNNLKKNLKNGNYRIKQRIVDRKFYQEEFKAIWAKQSEYYQTEFTNNNIIFEIADTFYKHNKEKNNELKSKDLFHIFFNDIIYYQRGLKSQKGLLANCQYEIKKFKDKDGIEHIARVKVASKSHPLFQEFRIWQTIQNLKIIQKEDSSSGKLKLNIDVSDQYLLVKNKELLFELFDNSKEVSHDAILRLLGFKKELIENREKTYNYKLNYPNDKDFQGNETKNLFRSIFKKHNFIEEGEKYISDPEKLHLLWHIIYSLPEEAEIISALNNKKYFDFPESVISHFSKVPEFKSQYGAYSTRALNNLLPLMRIGKYWQADNLSPKEKGEKGFSVKPTINLKSRIESISNWEVDPNIPIRVRELAQIYKLENIQDFQGLPTTLACYIAYGRHSEKVNEDKYESNEELDVNKLIPNNSLRNPVVEKIIRETLKLVKDVWADKDLGRPDYIHVELGREMKNNNEDRKKIYENNTNNRIEKDRVAILLKELKYPNFNPDSPNDLDKFKIWKENGGIEGEEIFDELFKKNKSEFIKDADIEKYRLWAEQGYKSPYTGLAIPLSDLYAIPKKYEIDHIIPRSRFYDDSLGNKVVIEAEVNALKGNKLAIQFIEDFQNQDIELSNGKKIRVLALENYKINVEEIFKNRKKKRHLKLYEIPLDFIDRQMNDTKYISRTIAQLLRPVAIGTDTDQGVVYTSGSITSDLKGKWGLHKLWKDLLKPRFERLENILGEELIIPNDKDKNGDYHFAKDYKRIDHRHHALDALVIACTTRSHIKYLNSLSSLSNDKKDFTRYEEWKKYFYLLNKKKQLEGLKNGMLEFATPWGTSESFYTDVKEKMESIIVSHKQTAKLISKASNKYWKWKEIDGEWKKVLDTQQAPKDEDKYWVAVRQSLFGQPLGKIHLAEYKKDVELKKAIKYQIDFIVEHRYHWNSEHFRIALSSLRKQVDKIIAQFNNDEKAILKYLEKYPLKDSQNKSIEKIDLLKFAKYASKRVSIDESFGLDKINALPYSEIEKNWLTNLLRKHLEEYDNPKEAFKGEALEQLFKKSPFPINKVTRKESGDKIEINNKLLDGDKGVNQYFIIEISQELDKKTGELVSKRVYSTPPFLESVKRLAKCLPLFDPIQENKYIVLSPGDLVYVPEINEQINQIDWSNKKNIAEKTYILKSFSKTQCFFIPSSISSPIIDTIELGANNKSERSFDGQMIKNVCLKIKIDRLGNITHYEDGKNNLNYSNDSSISIANEPLSPYTSIKTIIVSNSFEEAENSQVDYWANLSPEQRFKDFYALMLRFFTFNKPDWSKYKITL